MELKAEIDELLAYYPTLSYNKINNSLEGELWISEDDSYDILIKLSPYPKNFPTVFEKGERIPHKLERHIYINTKSCCFTTQAKAQILLKTVIKSLYLFVKDIIIPYLENNSYYELHGEYCFGEYSHNQHGIIEGYMDILQMKDAYLIKQLIINRIKGEKLRLHDQCYCGSGLSMKKCNNRLHYNCYKDFRKIDIEVLITDLQIF